MVAPNLAAMRTNSPSCGQKSWYSSPRPLQASRAPPGKSSTASPWERRLYMAKGLTGTAPYEAKRFHRAGPPAPPDPARPPRAGRDGGVGEPPQQDALLLEELRDD